MALLLASITALAISTGIRIYYGKKLTEGVEEMLKEKKRKKAA